MSKSNVIELKDRLKNEEPLTKLLRSGAQQLLHQAIEAELAELLAANSGRRTSDGKAAVIRNGHLPERALQTGIGPINIKVPKVRTRSGEPVVFRSALVPPYVRKTRTLEAALPLTLIHKSDTVSLGHQSQT